MFQIVCKMEIICSLLPGANKPIQPSNYNCDESDDIQEEDEEEEYDDTEVEEIFNNTMNTNGDNAVRTLPQPTRDFLNPLTVECDPVNMFLFYLVNNICNMVYEKEAYVRN